MKLPGIFIMVAVLMTSCGNNSRTTNDNVTNTDSATSYNSTGDSSMNEADTVLSGCYSMIVNRDTASLQLQVKGNQASGSLSYNLYEKDRNDGTFEGELNNGVLAGWYLFRSEGLMSVRQVAFKVREKALWPANGEVFVRNDSTLFKDVNKLRFDSTRAFRKVPCSA
jgi:hypothetical protein